VKVARPVIVIDLEEYRCAVKVKRAKIVLTMRVIGAKEIVENRNRLDEGLDGFRSVREWSFKSVLNLLRNAAVSLAAHSGSPGSGE
jgi:hypothetical protein